jgi:hypothetical protein
MRKKSRRKKGEGQTQRLKTRRSRGWGLVMSQSHLMESYFPGWALCPEAPCAIYQTGSRQYMPKERLHMGSKTALAQIEGNDENGRHALQMHQRLKTRNLQIEIHRPEYLDQSWPLQIDLLMPQRRKQTASNKLRSNLKPRRANHRLRNMNRRRGRSTFSLATARPGEYLTPTLLPRSNRHPSTQYKHVSTPTSPARTQATSSSGSRAIRKRIQTGKAKAQTQKVAGTNAS